MSEYRDAACSLEKELECIMDDLATLPNTEEWKGLRHSLALRKAEIEQILLSEIYENDPPESY
jgi:hypothetical protein